MFRIPLTTALLAFGLWTCHAAPSLEAGFDHPPKEHRPQVWWWFNAGDATQEAITRDLEGLARVGVSGFHIYGGCPQNRNWTVMVKWALHEAARLGLEGYVMIGAAGCGHPDTELKHAAKSLVLTTARAKGPSIRVSLPKKAAGRTPKKKDGSPAAYWDVAVLAVPDRKDVSETEVRDVSAFLDREKDLLVWPDAPEGTWRLVRVGYVPRVFGWMGCYIDHMSRAAFDAHWARVMTPLLNALAPDERSALKGVLCDSWEADSTNWTDTFADDFRRLHGYDILPWLPTLAGVPVGRNAQRARFIRDFKETISTLIAENHYAYKRDVAHRHGLTAVAEAAGPHQHQGDVHRMQGRCDVAMGEFWMPSQHRPLLSQRFMIRDAANAAHVYGLKEVLAEAFTTINTYWIESPLNMKPCADRAFCDGLTRVCYHGMKLSGSLTDKPGTIRNVGTHYNPQTTWFESSKAFNTYLSRCSWMLSQGRFHADCLIYAGDAINVFAGLKTPSTGLGAGYDYDFCPTELLLQARVENGEVVLPSGMHYRVILLSDRHPETARHMGAGKLTLKAYPPAILSVSEPVMLKLKALVEAGAVLAGPRPIGPISLLESSARFHEAADALWGPRGTKTTTSRAFGHGWVLADRAAAQAHLAERGLGPDFVARGVPVDTTEHTPPIDWIHRTLPDGTDIYFLSNQRDERRTFTGIFRQPDGRAATLWNPVTGERQEAERGPAIALDLPAYGSTFVVFGAQASVSPRPQPQATSSHVLSGPWTVSFDAAWGGPHHALNLTTLIDWTTHPDEGVRHYSGTALYQLTFDLPAGWQNTESIRLDLGTVHELADVTLNGQFLGTLWTRPFAVTVKNLRPKGNQLDIRVTNLWPNRLIGDAGKPAAERLTRTNLNPYKPTDPLLPSGLLGPVTLSRAK